jgi:hypothetical protein
MADWQLDPALMRRVLAHEAGRNPALRRRLAILEVLSRQAFLPWEALVAAVENVLEPGVFGAAPQSRLGRDLRALRDVGVAIGYSRASGTQGYYLRLESLPEPVADAIRNVFRELDLAHLDRVAAASPARRVEAVFEMIAFIHEVAAAGRQDREKRNQDE